MTDLTLDLLRWCSVRATDNGYAEVIVSMQYGGDHDAPWSFRDFKRMVEEALVTRNREIERKASYAVRMNTLAEERLVEVTKLKQGVQSLVALVDELEACCGVR